MKRHLLVASAFLLLTAFPRTHLVAQHIIPFIGGGLAAGTGDLGEDTGNGWFVVGGVDIPIAAVDPGFAVGVTASYSRIPYEGGFSEATQVTAISGELSYLIGDPANLLRPYLRAGGGLQVHRYDPGSIAANPVTDTRAGFTAGAGVNISTGGADVVLGSRFTTGSGGGFVGFHAGIALPLRVSP